jgi:hypothetical protein
MTSAYSGVTLNDHVTAATSVRGAGRNFDDRLVRIVAPKRRPPPVAA